MVTTRMAVHATAKCEVSWSAGGGSTEVVRLVTDGWTEDSRQQGHTGPQGEGRVFKQPVGRKLPTMSRHSNPFNGQSPLDDVLAAAVVATGRVVVRAGVDEVALVVLVVHIAKRHGSWARGVVSFEQYRGLGAASQR
mmetsp:Transcript_18430/g.52891  ORF Transcript_18430/g.52891 Transcript_18430/m.52891 type:complete len:137 (+) Transcript_18430:67-477(+)